MDMRLKDVRRNVNRVKADELLGVTGAARTSFLERQGFRLTTYLLLGRFPGMTNPKPTREAILDLAEELAQTRGYNAFSFQDLARGVGIRTASVHHHFPTKADLAREVMFRYREGFQARLESIAKQHKSPRRKLERFSELFRETLRRGNRLCLCGMLATEYSTLPKSVQKEVRAFYGETEQWLLEVIEEGRRSGVFRLNAPAEDVAHTFLAALEGAMIAARTFEDEKRLARAARWLLASLGL